MGRPLTKKQTEFKKLQAKWYKKLEKDGFEDIEQDEDNLKQWASTYFISRYTNFVGKSGKKDKAYDATWFTSQIEYYQMAGRFLHEHTFQSPAEKLIWQLHSEGVPNTGIYKELIRRGRKMYQDGVNKIVNTLKKQMVSACQVKKP